MIAMPVASQWTVLVAGEETAGRFAVMETRERPGTEPPRHVHSREDELIYVLEGRVTFNRDGERLDGPAGTWLFLPRGSEHTFSVESPEARLLVVLAPAGLENSLRESDQPDTQIAEQQKIERLVATAARYGVAITGPGPPGDRQDEAARAATSDDALTLEGARHMAMTLERQKRVNNDNRLIEFFEEATPTSLTALRPALIILAPQEISPKNRERDLLENATWEDAAFY